MDRFCATVDMLPEPMLVSVDGSIASANAASAHIFGWTSSDGSPSWISTRPALSSSIRRRTIPHATPAILSRPSSAIEHPSFSRRSKLDHIVAESTNPPAQESLGNLSSRIPDLESLIANLIANL
jgi:hypothetical protein